MFEIVLVTLGVVAFVALDKLQERHAPSSYYEPLDLAYGVDNEFNARKFLFRFVFPFAIGAVLAFCSRLLKPDSDALTLVVAAGAVGFLGCAVLVYPALKDPDMRPHYATPLSANTVTAYFSFIIANAILAALGARVALGIVATVAELSQSNGVRRIYDVWVTEHLPFIVPTTIVLGVVVRLWRWLVKKMVTRK